MGAGAGSDAAAPAAGPKAKGAGGDERAGGAQKGGNVSRPMPTPTCRIFVSNLPYTLDRKAALQAVADAGAAKGLASFTMRASNRRRKASRKARARTNQGFCLARYESEEDAARAHKAMRASGVAGRRPQLKFVTEAQAANDVHGEEGADGAGGEGAKKKAKSAKAGPPPAASEGRSVHLSGLADDITEAELWNAFNRKKLHSVKLPPPREGAAGGRVAFVHCLSQAFAARIVREAQEGSAPEGLRGVEGGEVAVSLAMSKKARVAAEAKRVAEAKAAEERKIKAEARARARAEREAAKAAEAAAAAARADEEGAAMDEGEDGGGSESSSDSDSDSGSSSDSDSGSSSDSDSD